MKNVIKILFPIIIGITVLFIGYRIIQISNNKKMREERIVHIPAFKVKTLEGNFFTNNDLKWNEPIVFIYFNSDCDNCQAETEEIISNIKKLNNIQIIYISNEPIPQIKAFQQKYKLYNYNNVKLLCDYNNKFAELLGLKTVPTSFIYNTDGILLNKNSGPIKVDYLLKNIK